MRGRAILLTLVLLAPLAVACAMGDIMNGGCGSHGTEDITVADLVATWSGPDAGRLTLNADNSFVAADLREKDGDRTRTVSGRGTWSLNQTSSSATKRQPGVSDIGLVFVDAGGGRQDWNRIDVDNYHRPVSKLQYLVGEPDSCDLRELMRS